MERVLGIDIGGTAIKLGILTATGEVLSRQTTPIAAIGSADELVATLTAARARLVAEAGGEICAVGICLPGYADPESGWIVDGCGNIPILRGRPFRDDLTRAFGLPVRLENDGVAATVGELRFGAGRRFARFALVTVGTGIGGALALEGRVLTGPRGEPPEFGAMVLEGSGIAGGRTFEDLASAKAFLRTYAAYSGGKEAADFRDLMARAPADEAAEAALEEGARRIAQALSILVNTAALDACLIGGGIAAAGERLLAPVRRHLAADTWPLLYRNVAVLAAERANDAGFIGAAALAFDALQRTP